MFPFNSLCFFSPSPCPMSRSRFSWEWENTGSLSCPLPFPIHNKQPETMATEAAGTEDACKGRDICAHRHVLHDRKHASSRTVRSLAVSEVGYRMWNPHSFWNPQSRENPLWASSFLEPLPNGEARPWSVQATSRPFGLDFTIPISWWRRAGKTPSGSFDLQLPTSFTISRPFFQEPLADFNLPWWALRLCGWRGNLGGLAWCSFGGLERPLSKWHQGGCLPVCVRVHNIAQWMPLWCHVCRLRRVLLGCRLSCQMVLASRSGLHSVGSRAIGHGSVFQMQLEYVCRTAS